MTGFKEEGLRGRAEGRGSKHHSVSLAVLGLVWYFRAAGPGEIEASARRPIPKHGTST